MVCGGYDPHARAPTANCSFLSSPGGPPPPYEWVDDLLLAAPRENAFAVELENGMWVQFTKTKKNCREKEKTSSSNNGRRSSSSSKNNSNGRKQMNTNDYYSISSMQLSSA